MGTARAPGALHGSRVRGRDGRPGGRHPRGSCPLRLAAPARAPLSDRGAGGRPRPAGRGSDCGELGRTNALEPDDAAPIIGAVLANEVLDALPVHRVVGRDGGGLAELFVELDPAGALATVPGPPSTRALAARLADEGIRLADGQPAEICLAIEPWMAAAAAGLDAV